MSDLARWAGFVLIMVGLMMTFSILNGENRIANKASARLERWLDSDIAVHDAGAKD